MKTFFTLFTLSLLLLIAGSANARKDLGQYWKDVTKDQRMPQSIQNLVHVDSAMSVTSNQKAKIVGQGEGKPLVKDFNHHPESTDNQKSFVKNFKSNPIFYPAYSNAKPTDKKSFVKNFKPSPIFYPAYAKPAEDKKFFAKNFEASAVFYPAYAAYSKSTNENSLGKDSELKPTTKNTNEKSFVKDSETQT